ncbi:MAG: serine/threonine protein kinase [Deltaproteobacteria bacterium]|nr:serine/threonine protein kinase [Deltaproteobacteria bacterium]
MSAAPPESTGPRLSDTGSLKTGDTLSGKYKVEKLLGEGGMGEVFVAEDADLGRKVALKVLRGLGATGQAAAEERLRREARTLAAIGHPNIVQIFDIGRTHHGAPFLVMELLEGETLFDRASRERQLPIKRAVEIVADVLSALQAVHAKGIVHRDMKPENVFLARDATGRETVKLLDLGIAKALVPEANAPALTETGAIVGTPYYMAPEQAMGSPDIDGRADLYAVGGILYTLLAGKTPFTASNVLALLRMIVDTDPAPVEQLRQDVPAALGEVIRRAMSRDRSERFPDAQAFLEALAPFATLIMPRQDLGRSSRTSDAAPGPAGAGFARLMYAALGLVAIALVAFFAWPRERNRPRPHRERPRVEAVSPASLRPEPVPVQPGSEAGPSRRVFLEVSVAPLGAAVTLDGVPISDGGFVVEPSERLRKLVVWAEDYVTQEREIIVQANERLQITLEAERSGSKRVTGRPRPGGKGTYRGNIGITTKSPYGRGP